MATQQAVRVMVNPQAFSAGVATAKRLRGTYEPQTKTWMIPAAMVEFLAETRRAQYPGLIIVDAAAAAALRPSATPARPVQPGVVPAPGTCPHYTRDQGCPLHGELCGGR